jgi:hypothetical protein
MVVLVTVGDVVSLHGDVDEEDALADHVED